MDLGLERIRRLLHVLGNPQRAYDVIHVAGTNGKGLLTLPIKTLDLSSICATLATLLHHTSTSTHRPLRIARLTSPHLLHPSDSLSLNDSPVSPSTYSAALSHVSLIDSKHGIGCTSFELATAAALSLFQEKEVDLAVVEVGLGGRLDATNVFDDPANPPITVLASVGLDHTAQLGPTVRHIATEKCGIFKKGCIAVISPQQFATEVREVVQREAERAGVAQVVWVERAEWVEKAGREGTLLTPAPSTSSSAPPAEPFSLALGAFPADHPSPPRLAHIPSPPNSMYPPLTYPLSLPGAFQLSNSATAIAALRALVNRSNMKEKYARAADPETIARGMAAVKWPGRLEWRTIGTMESVDKRGNGRAWFLVDGAHNTQSAIALRTYIDGWLASRHGPATDTLPPVTWALALAAHKSPTDVLPHLLRPGDIVHTATFPTPIGMPWVSATPHAALASAVVDCGATTAGEVRDWDVLKKVVDDAWRNGGSADMPQEGPRRCHDLYRLTSRPVTDYPRASVLQEHDLERQDQNIEALENRNNCERGTSEEKRGFLARLGRILFVGTLVHPPVDMGTNLWDTPWVGYEDLTM
ncbi:hypothetical protein HDU93_008128 [Gonapodya sp. JEL0774]|nr:hypothetical protein HDU93_008128 [Gonapodya sp. JEL0774]